MSSNAEKSVGNPVVIVDLATGLVIQGTLSGVTQAGINKLTFMSIHIKPDAEHKPPCFHSNYTRVPAQAGYLAKVEIEAIIK